MRYGSVCSGIEAASVAWEQLGWKPSFFSEIDPFPRAVLRHRFPEVPLHGDFTTIKARQYEPIDLLVGGTPCQSFSVAGLRGGLGDDRGNLALEYLCLADRLRPRWLVWENVPGVLSSGGGRDFGAILGGMVELGYGFAYRVLDAQYVRVDGLERAVPQRRRRVFVVGYLGDWRRAAAVLFERESLCGHPPPRRQAGQEVARPIGAGSEGSSGYRLDADTAENLIADVVGTLATGGGGRAFPGTSAQCAGEGYLIASTGDIAHCLNAGGMGRIDYETETMIAFAEDGAVSSQLTTGGGKPGQGHPAIAFNMHKSGNDASSLGVAEEHTDCLRAFEKSPFAVHQPGWAVRRLTPTECERLQGFPDNWTAVPYRGKPAADGPRYKALGNSMAVNVMRWIGRRIELVNALEAALPMAAE